MGRETRILLALLGLLVGIFLGVVSLKLFVPRPPAGAGPDVHTDIASVEAQQLVEPPALAPPPAAPPPSDVDMASPSSRFGAGETTEPRPRDPFVQPASFESPAELAPLIDAPPPIDMIDSPDRLPPPNPVFVAHPTTVTQPSPEPPAPPPTGNASGSHLTQPGESWWSLAEGAYGDGRLYRALFAWNRARDPRISLAPGTQLEIPPLAQLAAAWPGLVPRD